MSAKYIIRNATVVSVDPTIGTVANCDVMIENRIIANVGKDLKYSSEHIVIDGTDAIVSPGFVDTHRHTWQTQLRTIATDFVLSDYFLALRQVYGACYSAHDAYLGNYCGALESIDHGITYLVDHSHVMNSPDHADAALKGLRDARIRAVFCYASYKNPAWEHSQMSREREEHTPNWRWEDAKRIKETYFKSNAPQDLLRFGFALCEPEITPITEVVEELKLARSLGAAVITGHISYGKWDPGNFITRKLDEKGLLGPDFLISHGNTLAADELRAVKENGVGISCTPDTELQMGMSHPVAFKAKDLGCNVSLGVDVCCSCPADMFAQMRLALQSQRHLEHEQAPGAPTKVARKCEEVLEIATMGGAKAVGLEKVIGSITPGKRADIIITRCDSTRLVPAHDPVGALVLYANGSDIDTVFINGEMVKSGGKLTNVDWEETRKQLRASTASIMERAKKAPQDEVEAARVAMIKALDSINRRRQEQRESSL